jgi:hypothetical protein
MNSSIQLEKFTGDSSVHPKTWWNKFQQWVDLYDIPQDKITKVITFQFADEAAVWYATLKPEITNNFQKFKEAFFKILCGSWYVLVNCVLCYYYMENSPDPR